jgi:serine/threonine protein phosphatase 1
MNRTLVIGDIHGAFKALQQIIEKAAVKETDQLIFLGDFVDGWSQSFEVIQYLIELEKKFKCVFIKGNHDLWCEQWLEKKIEDETWLFNGGRATFRSYESRSEAEKLNHLAFFQRMQNYFIDEENRLFIHAGFSSLHGPYKEHYSSNYSWDRTLWELVLCLDKNLAADHLYYPKRLKLYHEIFIGHTPVTQIGKNIPVISEQPFHSKAVEESNSSKASLASEDCPAPTKSMNCLASIISPY